MTDAGLNSDTSSTDLVAAQAVFGTAVDAAKLYWQWLAGPGIERGLIGPREVPRLWQRHILNSAVLATALVEVPSSAVLVDVGSGAGLPGIPLALLRPDITVVLLEPMQRRCDFLAETITALGLSNCSVLRARAQEAAGMDADVVTSRAVAALDKLAGWSVPVLRDGGLFLPLKGNRAHDEVATGAQTLKTLGIVDIGVLELGAGVLDEVTYAVAGTLDRRVAGSAKGGRSKEGRAGAGRAAAGRAAAGGGAGSGSGGRVGAGRAAADGSSGGRAAAGGAGAVRAGGRSGSSGRVGPDRSGGFARA